MLGVIVNKDLKWNGQLEKLKGECQYRQSILRRLRKYLTSRQIKTIAEGLVFSRLRYCLLVWGADFLRLTDSDPLCTIAHELQVIQNDTLRIITGRKRSDHVRIEDMLSSTNMLSVNQLTAYGILIETWKAREFDVPHLSSLLVVARNDVRNLRSNGANLFQASIAEQFALCAEKLWNLSSDHFKKTNLLSVAKIEAKKVASQLPI